MTRTGLEKILDRSCGQFGYCLDGNAQARIAESPPESPKLLVDAVIRGDGRDPDLVDRHMHRQMRDLVAEDWHWLE